MAAKAFRWSVSQNNATLHTDSLPNNSIPGHIPNNPHPSPFPLPLNWNDSPTKFDGSVKYYRTFVSFKIYIVAFKTRLSEKSVNEYQKKIYINGFTLSLAVKQRLVYVCFVEALLTSSFTALHSSANFWILLKFSNFFSNLQFSQKSQI